VMQMRERRARRDGDGPRQQRQGIGRSPGAHQGQAAEAQRICLPGFLTDNGDKGGRRPGIVAGLVAPDSDGNAFANLRRRRLRLGRCVGLRNIMPPRNYQS
jgi:hypothetical protein